MHTRYVLVPLALPRFCVVLVPVTVANRTLLRNTSTVAAAPVHDRLAMLLELRFVMRTVSTIGVAGAVGVAERVVLAVAPALSVTVSVTVYVPAAA